MPLPRQTQRRELLRKFRALGWTGPFSGRKHEFVRKGAHTVRIPNPHVGDIDISLLKEILKQADILEADWQNA
jgi:predicted RNA binding protein YcfA (HicA-like mRNA interferase family)